MDFEQEFVESLKRQLIQMAVNEKTNVWVDSNVVGFASKADKNRLIKFTNLRTVPQVIEEVSRKPKAREFLREFREKATVVGPSYFSCPRSTAVLKNAVGCCKQYSPMARVAAQKNFESSGSSSPVVNNSLLSATKESDIFDYAHAQNLAFSAMAAASGGAISAPAPNAVKRLEKSWLKYHRDRQRGIRENTYLWTDELLVANAIADACVNNRVTIILTTDWDANSIMKQYIDNVLSSIVDLETQNPEMWWTTFSKKSKSFDAFLRTRKHGVTDAICNGQIINAFKEGDVLIWQFSSENFWPFSFPEGFTNRLNSMRYSWEHV